MQELKEKHNLMKQKELYETKIRDNVPFDANKLIDILQKNGHEAYLVGGCIRDCIIDRPVHDWDICTSATPDEMLRIFNDKKIIETGLQHGTVTVIVNGEPYEITTYRVDGIYSDGRRPDSVAFTSDLAEDLKRRDFTINAMVYNDNTGLIDPFHGLEDIDRKQIRCIGLAKERFDEDALRILRAIRFSSQLDFEIESHTHEAIMNQYENLQLISMERIQSEFCKIAVSKTFAKQLRLYKEVFSFFIPEFGMLDFPQNNPYHEFDVYGHTIRAVEQLETDDLVTRLAVFFHDFGKPHLYQDDADGTRHFRGHGKVSAELADCIMKRLKFDNNTRNNVVELVYYHDAVIECSKKSVKRWLNKIGETQFARLLDIRIADIKGQKCDYDTERVEQANLVKTILNEILQETECFSLKDLAVNGNDLIQAGYKSGKELGVMLQRLLDAVMNDELKNDKDTLLIAAKEWRK